MHTDHQTNAGVVADVAAQAAGVTDLELTTGVTAQRGPNGQWTITDDEALLVEPRRPSGTTTTHTAEGFARAVQQRSSVAPALYVDEESLALVAVLNDDTRHGAGWRDLRVNLSARPTPEWDLWTKGQGLGDQERFASLIEDGQQEIVTPAPAVMLDIAQTFHATTNGRFRQAGSLRTGARQLVYEEEIEAGAGRPDESTAVAIPETFEIAVRPFYGSVMRDDEGGWKPARYPVTARLKFRLNAGKLAIGYELVRPDEVRRAAFAAFAEQVAESLSCEPIAGIAPAPRTAAPLVRPA